MSVDFEIKRKITVNGQEYDSLDQIPEEFRTAVQNALARGGVAQTTIHINGKTYSSIEELPAPLRAMVAGVTSLAMKSASEARAVRPEPVLSAKKLVIAVGLALVLFWLVRMVF